MTSFVVCPRTTRPIVFILACALASTSCASLAHGSRQVVSFTSEPSGAAVKVDGDPIGFTPLTFPLSRRHNHVVRFDKAGFWPRQVWVPRGPSAWLLADIPLGGDPLVCQGLTSSSQCGPLLATGIAMTIGADILTGAAYTLPKRVHAVLLSSGR